MKLTRKEAKEQGLKKYFTGKSCCRDHISERYVVDGGCVECCTIRNKANKNAVLEWKKNNKQRLKEYNRKYWKEHGPSHRKRNAGKVNARAAKRRSAKIQRSPSWADQEAIQFFYDYCPMGYHVDHIIPLQGKNISGLHTAENLQWLPAEENLKKHNKYAG